MILSAADLRFFSMYLALSISSLCSASPSYILLRGPGAFSGCAMSICPGFYEFATALLIGDDPFFSDMYFSCFPYLYLFRPRLVFQVGFSGWICRWNIPGGALVFVFFGCSCSGFFLAPSRSVSFASSCSAIFFLFHLLYLLYAIRFCSRLAAFSSLCVPIRHFSSFFCFPRCSSFRSFSPSFRPFAF